MGYKTKSKFDFGDILGGYGQDTNAASTSGYNNGDFNFGTGQTANPYSSLFSGESMGFDSMNYGAKSNPSASAFPQKLDGVNGGGGDTNGFWGDMSGFEATSSVLGGLGSLGKLYLMNQMMNDQREQREKNNKFRKLNYNNSVSAYNTNQTNKNASYAGLSGGKATPGALLPTA